MKHFCATLLFLFAVAAATAQTLIQWQKTFGGTAFEAANCTWQTDDGGFVVAGRTASMDGDLPGEQGGDDVWVIKMDDSGAVQWQRTFGGTKNEAPNAIKQTTDGGFIIVGETDSDDEMMYGNHGQVDTWVVKMNSEGGIEWKRVMGGSLCDIAHDVLLTPDGGYLLVGKSESSDGDVTENRGEPDFWVVKLDGIGITQWQKTYGGSSFDVANAGFIDNDGNVIISGISYSNDGDVSGNHGSGDIWIVKLSETGVLESQKSLGGSDLDSTGDLIPATDGGIIVTGCTFSNNGDVAGLHGDQDIWVVKLTSTFEIQWQKALGGSKNEYATSIVTTNDGGFVIGGQTNSTNGNVQGNDGFQEAWVIKLNGAGALVWQKTFGGTGRESCYDLLATADNGFMMVGFTDSSNGDVVGDHVSGDSWIVKLSSGLVGITEGTAEVHSSQMQVYPSPASTSVTLKTDGDEDLLKARLSDMSGREISGDILLNGGELDIALLPNGLYVVSVTAASGKVYVQRFRKQD